MRETKERETKERVVLRTREENGWGRGVEAEARDRKAGGKTAHAPSSSTWCITCCPLLKPPCLRLSFFLSFLFFPFLSFPFFSLCLSFFLFYPVLSCSSFSSVFSTPSPPPPPRPLPLPRSLSSPCSTLVVPLVLAHPSLISSPPSTTS